MIEFIFKKMQLFLITMFILTLILFWAHIRLGDLEINRIVPDYIHYATDLITLKFGNSSESGMPIIEEMKLFFPPTVELLLLSLVISFGFGIFLGIVGGLNHHSFTDKCIYGYCLLSSSVPVYWSAQIFILLFCIYIKIFPTSGNISLLYDVPRYSGFMTIDVIIYGNYDVFMDMLKHLALPLTALSIVPCATFARITRRATINLTQKYFIKAAYCRGESKFDIGVHHVLRNILPDIIQKLNIIICNLYSSCILVEVIFEWPGTGLWITQSISNSDGRIIEATTFVLGTSFLILNITLDILSTLVINRTRLTHS
ncbi:MAG: ABC transporter permease subunit [Ruminobacter sp.]|jgi:ABC-type antimicrobial peptide transport system permease subunit|uniref:Cationic peptide transport system permease protein n=1 Tax=Ruminobacter amylophilus TaxID=867 RepID=A0A662ZFZ1_9GAMM|nr:MULTISPECIES: ABC transporter permease subunit [Ruminobacter]MBQ3774854.1 ABC transporter permease subunit [Ruminobacter sp.]SFP22086.1 cationic peptide transport system permease protein [Ruminobacter amylophilus]